MDSLIWGPYKLSRRFGTGHFLVAGTTGSGKTTLVDVLLRCVMSDDTKCPSRVFLYDPKQDALGKIHGLGLESKAKILHPFSESRAAWDMAADIDDALSAIQLAQTLIPDSNPGAVEGSFFDEASRDLLSGVVQVFARCAPKKEWEFRDILLALLYPRLLEFVLRQTETREGNIFPLPRRLWDAYANPETTDERTRANIRATLNAKLSVFEPVAASWSQATERFSLTKWVEDDRCPILVLGNDEAARAAIDPINRAVFQRAAELTLARDELSHNDLQSGNQQTWFFLDEVRQAGRLNSLNSLLTKGRSKGACVVISFQDIDGIRAVYGRELANEIVANCNNIALLKTSSASTAQWAAEMFGRFLIHETDSTEGISAGSISSSKTTKVTERSPVQPGELLYLPLPTAEKFVGFFRDASALADEPKRRTLHTGQLRSLQPPKVQVSFRGVDRAQLYLKPWDQADWDRLGYSGDVPSWTEDATPSGQAPTRRPRSSGRTLDR